MAKTRVITVRGVPDTTLQRLRDRAAARRRSLNGELLMILDHVAAEESKRAGHEDPSGPAASTPRVIREPSRSPYAAPLGSADSQLETVDLAAVADVCRRHHIRWLAVFGSYAHGDARPDSDVDVVVDFEPGMTPGLGLVRVADALRPVLGDRRVDLVTRHGLAPRMRGRILSTARTLYGAE